MTGCLYWVDLWKFLVSSLVGQYWPNEETGFSFMFKASKASRVYCITQTAVGRSVPSHEESLIIKNTKGKWYYRIPYPV